MIINLVKQQRNELNFINIFKIGFIIFYWTQQIFKLYWFVLNQNDKLLKLFQYTNDNDDNSIETPKKEINLLIKLLRLNSLVASVITLDNETVRRRSSFIRRHLFIPAGMVTMGEVHFKRIRADRRGTWSPLRPHHHLATVA